MWFSWQTPHFFPEWHFHPQTDAFFELSHPRNVQQEPENQESPSLVLHLPAKTCAGPSSIHPPVGSWRDPERRTDVSRRQAASSLTRALSEPGVPRQLNLSSGQSEESGSRPISLHYGTALLLRCRVPVVLQGSCCLIHHQETKGLAGGWRKEEKGGGSFLPLKHTLTLYCPPPPHPPASTP